MAKRLLAYEAIAQETIASSRRGLLPSVVCPTIELALRCRRRSTIREALRLLGGRGTCDRGGSGGGAFVKLCARGRTRLGDDLAFLMGCEAISVGELGSSPRHEVINVRLAARRAGPPRSSSSASRPRRVVAADDPTGSQVTRLPFYRKRHNLGCTC